jgi:hypothetical protein
VNNGVEVRYGAADGSGHTQIGVNVDPNTGSKVVTNSNPTGQQTVVTIDPADNRNANELAITVAHEGSHVADGADLVGELPTNLTGPQAQQVMNGPLNLTKWATETRAYQASAFAAQQVFPNRAYSFRGYEIWNPSWAEADRGTLRNQGIFNILKDPDGQYRLNPYPSCLRCAPTDFGARLIP